MIRYVAYTILLFRNLNIYCALLTLLMKIYLDVAIEKSIIIICLHLVGPCLHGYNTIHYLMIWLNIRRYLKYKLF